MNKIINWFEIPALDISRARAFYETILGVSLNEHAMGAQMLAVFPYNRETDTGGCVILGPGYRPGSYGPIIYLNCGSDLNSVLDRVAAAGGSIVTPRTELPPGMGAYAHVRDTEGNRVGLHGQA
ncbi:MAG: VOC family protein [Terracidiphilus sp.]|nr:VOC family protein [Terracidiphilus sp.]